jgi:hypothetical protein
MSDPDLLFEFFLAEEKRCLVSELRERIGNDEFIYWVAYYGIKAQQQEMQSMRMK